ncbi:Transmembrane protein 62 [Tritrichomonas musculus]|uniref:Transmembrane protein 62 n=1 Tax=Tritrichomonas musculus TaxID=1915356 RepID=A0ABR2KCW6_9EUKA
MARELHSILYISSQYSWLAIFGSFFFIFYLTLYYHDPPTINSLPSSKWDSASDPHIFGLVSDIHISKYNNKTSKDTESALSIFTESGVEKILICGDLVENFEGKSSLFRNSRQLEEEFVQYKKLEDKYQKDFIIVASGNHDEFTLDTYNSKIHYLLKYCSYYSKNNFFADWKNFVISKFKYHDIEIFVLNIYNYPSSPSRIGHYSDVTPEILDIIEQKLSEPSNSTVRLLINHYPLHFYNEYARSSSKKNLIEIISSYHISAVLTGHTHKMRIMHHNETLEIHPYALKTFREYAYISMDNGGLSFHEFSLNNDKPLAILTYPINKKLISKETDFTFSNFEKADIRVICFSERQDLKINVHCHWGNNTNQGALHFQRIIRTNESLYSIPLKDICKINDDHIFIEKKFEEFHLSFSGDWNHSTDFIVGDSATLSKEYLENDFQPFYGLIFISLIYYLIVLFVFGPFPPSTYCQKANEWISNMSEEHCILGVIFGFLPMKARIYNNFQRTHRNTIFFVALFPFFLPSGLIRFYDQSYGFFFIYGYYFKKVCYDLYGQIFAAFFVIIVLLPATIVFSSLAQLQQMNRWCPAFYFDVFFGLLQIPLTFFGIFTIMHQSTNLVLSILSPYFSFAPIILIILQLHILYKYTRNLKSNEILLSKA